MNHPIIHTATVAACLLAVTACERQSAEERRTSTRTEPAPVVTVPAAPQPAAPQETEQALASDGSAEAVGVTETTGATTGASTAGTASSAATSPDSPLPTNLPPFEGELRMNVAGRTPETLDYAMKGDKIRLGVSATPGRKDKGIDAIIDTSDQKATILLNDRKEFVEIDLAKLAQKAKARVEDVDVERTGRTETISGRQCEEWKIKDREYQVTACVAKGAPYFDLDALEKQASFKAPSWVHRVVDAGYIPLRVSINDASGKSLASSQVADTSRKVDASKFEVPVGYKKAAPASLPGIPK